MYKSLMCWRHTAVCQNISPVWLVWSRSLRLAVFIWWRIWGTEATTRLQGIQHCPFSEGHFWNSIPFHLLVSYPMISLSSFCLSMLHHTRKKCGQRYMDINMEMLSGTWGDKPLFMWHCVNCVNINHVIWSKEKCCAYEKTSPH